MKENPKTLIVGVDAWRTDSPSNTLQSIFSCWNPDKIALVYARSNYPNCQVSRHYFQISENKVLKSIFKPWLLTGREVKNVVEDVSDDIRQEQKRYAKAHKKYSPFMTLCREIVWILGHWKKKALKEFVEVFEPDILFLPIFNKWYMCQIELFLVKLTKKPYVVYYADDDFSYDMCHDMLSYLHRFVLRKYVRKLIMGSREIFVIADKVKEEIDSIFEKDCKLLTKGVDFEKVHYDEKIINSPIRFVYTGNLLIGRDQTMISIAKAINTLDPNGKKAVLDIYSQTELSEETLARLNCGGCKFKGKVSREMIDGIQRDADVLIFAEALNGKDVYAARMSFSTKLTDYMANGKCIFAVGTPNIAPIHYLRKYDAALIATTEKEIMNQIHQILEHPEIIKVYGRKAIECAKRNHNKAEIDATFCKTMYEAAKHND